MKAEERHKLERNALDQGLSNLVEKAKSGAFLTTKTIVFAAAALALIGAVWYWSYARRQHQQASAKMWHELEQQVGPAGLEEFAKTAPDRLAGRVARLQLARVWLGPEGLQKLSSTNPADRKKAIENIEKAREEFRRLADEFKDDLTLKGQCLDGEAHAELALVGIPKEGTFDQYRGDVDKAAERFREYARLVGEGTKAGEEAKKRADELVANKQEVLRVAQALHNRLTPAATPGIDLPKAPSGLTPGTPPPPPKAPETVPPAGPTPPAGTPEAPKAPTPAAGGQSGTNTPAAPGTPPPAAPTPPPPATKK